MKSPRSLAAVVVFVSGVIVVRGVPAGPQVRIRTGTISGKVVGEAGAVRAFLGIPYAKPPVGGLRWRPPQPVEPWEGVRDCTRFGPSCPQPKSLFLPPPGPFKEDCLYLNVWTPTKSEDRRLPVMVWIHGGGFTTGSGGNAVYDGRRLAAEGAVVVTVNYRLGPFGFFAHPALSAESAHGVSGNYGLLDQIAALQWVRSNIAVFGGDAGNVTVFGESAGAVSIGCLLVSPLAKGLFHRAVLESGVAVGIRQWLKKPAHGRPAMEQVGRHIAGRLGLTPEAQTALRLRNIPAAKLLEAANPRVGLFGKGTKIWPCVDGYVLPDEPARLLEAGRFHAVPVMVGTNADEGTVFVKRQLPVRGIRGYRFILRLFFRRDGARRVEAMYPAGRDDRASVQLAKVITDSTFIAPTRRFARDLARRHRAPVYAYHFTRVSPGARRNGAGATHGAEILYVFGTCAARFGFEERDLKLSETMRGAWVRFAETGDPNGPGLPHWPAYSLANEPYLEFGDRIRVAQRLHADACDLFDELTGPRSQGVRTSTETGQGARAEDAGTRSNSTKPRTPPARQDATAEALSAAIRRKVRQYETRGPFSVKTLEFPNLVDAKRDRRPVPIKVHYPSAPGPWPLLVFSHGGMGNWDSHIYLAQHLASHGYVSLCVEDVFSNGKRTREIIAEATGTFRRRLDVALKRITTDPNAMLERPRDIGFAIDRAVEWDRTLPPLKGRIRTDRIAVIGHSYGAYTVLAACGARPILDYLDPPVPPGKGLGPDLSDPRITIGVAMSPQGPGTSRFGKESFRTIRRPLLCFSGSRDMQLGHDGRLQPAEARLEGFRLMPPGNKLLLWLENADHLSFAFSPRGAKLAPSPARDDAKRIVTVMTAAFCDLWLKNDAAAGKLLNPAVADTLCGNVVTRVTWHRK
ncbi:MAG: carboxylesterase family protein [Kiritimatiellaeota bacterium]|nr:carboxylesterase family protein [Kiritimatiellota bacterium]